jgi:hypothetical protein
VKRRKGMSCNSSSPDAVCTCIARCSLSTREVGAYGRALATRSNVSFSQQGLSSENPTQNAAQPKMARVVDDRVTKLDQCFTIAKAPFRLLRLRDFSLWLPRVTCSAQRHRAVSPLFLSTNSIKPRPEHHECPLMPASSAAEAAPPAAVPSLPAGSLR